MTTHTRRARITGFATLAAAAGLVAAACKTPDASRAAAADAGSAAPAASAPLSVPHAAPTESPGSDEIRPLYPIDAGPPDPLAQRFCDAIYAVPAERAAVCCGAADDAGPAPRIPGIAAGFAGQCVRTLTAAMRTHAVTLAPADVDACAEAIAKATLGCDWVTLTFSVPIPPACDGILAGQLHEKAECRSSLECAAGLRCQGLSAIEPGICGRPKAAGEECNLAIDSLAALTRQDHFERAHAECDGYCTGRRCQVAVPEGGACKADVVCGKGRCEGGKCTAAPLPGSGEACSGPCGYGLRCIEGRCNAPKAEGAACKTALECRGACVTGDGGTGGTCQKTCAMQLKLPKLPKAPPPPRPMR